jgi:hypothetical protein
MDYRQSDKSSKKISQLIKEINEWLKNVETNYNGIDNQQLYKNYEKAPDLIEKIDEWLKNNKNLEKYNRWLEKQTNKNLEYHIEKLIGSLNKMAERIRKKDYMYKIFGYHTYLTLYCNKRSDKEILCEHDIKIDVYNMDFVIGCFSDIKYSPYKIRCINYRANASFELSYPISLIKGIRNSILDILNILNPGALKNLDEQFIHIRDDISVYLYKQIKKNREIIKKDNLFIYDNDRFRIEMTWHYDNPSRP